jgi:hypothetical protein
VTGDGNDNEQEPDLKDVSHYVDAQRMDHQHLSSLGRMQQIAELRTKLLLLPQNEFDLAMKTLSKLVGQGPKEKRMPAPVNPDENDSVTLYDEVRPAGGDDSVQGVSSI